MRRAKEAGLTWPLPDTLQDAQLEPLMFPLPHNVHAEGRPVMDWPEVHKQLKLKGVTLQLLWEEHRRVHANGYGYSRCCELYAPWERTADPVMIQEHKAGDKLFVDYAGQTMPQRRLARERTERRRILLIHTDPRVQRLLSVSLRRHGYSAVCALDLCDATRTVDSDPPCLVISELDIRIDDNRTLRSANLTGDTTAPIPIIVLMPKHLSFDVLANWDGIDVDAWVKWPVDTFTLVYLVKRLLGDLEGEESLGIMEIM